MIIPGEYTNLLLVIDRCLSNQYTVKIDIFLWTKIFYHIIKPDSSLILQSIMTESWYFTCTTGEWLSNFRIFLLIVFEATHFLFEKKKAKQ